MTATPVLGEGKIVVDTSTIDPDVERRSTSETLMVGGDADGPASTGWRPGFMTDLMAEDLDLAIGFAARSKTPLFTGVCQLPGAASAAGYGGEDFSAMGKIIRSFGGV